MPAEAAKCALAPSSPWAGLFPKPGEATHQRQGHCLLAGVPGLAGCDEKALGLRGRVLTDTGPRAEERGHEGL